jgi:molybdopterin converting factor small subunit
MTKKTKHLHLRLAANLADDFATICEQQSINRSGLVRQWIRQYIKKNKEATTMTNTKLYAVIEDNYGKLYHAIVEAKKDMEGLGHGWKRDVEINKLGEVSTTPSFSVNSMSDAAFNRETMIVATIKGWQNEVTVDDLIEMLPELSEQFEQSEYDYFSEYLADNHPEELADAGEEIKEYNRDSELWSFENLIDEMYFRPIRRQHR